LRLWQTLRSTLCNIITPNHLPITILRYASPMILIIYAHPYPQHSRASRALLNAVRHLPDVEVRSLYDLYPDFDIDVAAEQAALTRADLVVWLHPIYWYSAPAMLKHWFDVVLLRGWAYGHGGAGAGANTGNALRDKHCLWVTTTGGTAETYTAGGVHQLPFEDFEAPIRQTAKFCGMVWESPLSLHGAHVSSDADIANAANIFQARLAAFAAHAPSTTTEIGHAD
jgi:glutathione-regulated potassium-efflux system ancillary protein KefF